MKNQTSYKLIEGKFSPSEAKEVLTQLIKSKINYHAMEKVGILVRNEGDVAHSEKRMEALKNVQASINELLAYSIDKEFDLQISCNIDIVLLPKYWKA